MLQLVAQFLNNEPCSGEESSKTVANCGITSDMEQVTEQKTIQDCIANPQGEQEGAFQKTGGHTGQTEVSRSSPQSKSSHLETHETTCPNAVLEIPNTLVNTK
jgi:hypothetical protein